MYIGKGYTSMNNAERALLELIKASLFSIPPHIPEDTDWTAVMNEAKSQAVLAIAAQSLPAEQYQLWTKNVYRQIANYYRVLHAQDELVRLFYRNGIQISILKGTAAAVYYPVPSRRAMGDIDFIVLPERFEEAQKLMESNGYTVAHKEKRVFRHIGYEKSKIAFELHCKFSSHAVDVETIVMDGLRHIETKELEEYTFPVLPKLAGGIVLLAHISFHLQSGLGLRQMIDWMMYVDKELDDAYWESRFCAAATEAGLDKLAIVSTRLCQKYLGLRESITWCSGADEALCDELLEELLFSGNFGKKQGIGAQVETVMTAIRGRGLFSYLQYAGKYNWTAYHRHSWLAPVCWLYQIFRYMGQVPKLMRRKNRLRDDLDHSKERYQLLQKLGF